MVFLPIKVKTRKLIWTIIVILSIKEPMPERLR